MRKNKILIVFLALLLIPAMPGKIYADYVRPNHFMDLSGSERTAEIKKFQALNNIPISGKVDSLTNEVLYNPNIIVRDIITHRPTTGKWVVINKTKRILTMYNDDKPMYKFPVALGKYDTPTPSVKSKVQNRHVNPAWGGMNGKYTPVASGAANNPLGKRWMGLYVPEQSGYGMHGTIKPWEIGRYVSNGCIRMFNYDVENFIYPNTYIGMPVWIGTDEELKNWGVLQVIEKKLPESQTQEKSLRKEYPVGELLEF